MLDNYRREYADFNAAQMREYYMFLSGQKAELEIAPIYDRYSDLFTDGVITELKQNLDETPDRFETERIAIKRLLSFAIDLFLGDSTKELTETISEYESGAKVECAGRSMTFQDSAVTLTNEPDRQSRRAIYKGRLNVIEASNDFRAERLTRLHSSARSLGYSSYTSLYEEMFGHDYAEFAKKCQSFLARTESVYLVRLDEALKRDLGLKIEEAERSDAAYFLHLTGYDDRFPADDLMRVYSETLSGLGICVDAQKNITVDAEPRPRKSSRAFCVAIRVPEEVKLVIKPSGGQSDYQAFLHEAGHAQHYGSTSAALRPEFKYTGDYALTETYAFLFNHLVSDSAWLEEFLGFRDNRPFTRSVILTRLVTVRRYAAKLIYERELHLSEDYAQAAALYTELQTNATRFKSEPTEFLFDLDDAFYCANYLRAWAFEVALREYLKERFGNQWWRSRRAGNFLREIWETGDRYTADEMARQIGMGAIEFDLLIDEFNRALK